MKRRSPVWVPNQPWHRWEAGWSPKSFEHIEYVGSRSTRSMETYSRDHMQVLLKTDRIVISQHVESPHAILVFIHEDLIFNE